MRNLIAQFMLFVLLLFAAPAAAFAGVRIVVAIAPPPLPVYVQPACPGDGYIWVPGYWAWDDADADYYWVPGTWVFPPEEGLLWTPGYWAWDGDGYIYNAGYWGPTVGFYGGVDYGFGYFGVGFVGGHWDGSRFYYNRAVTNVNVNVVHNYVYNDSVRNVTVNHVSYDGGNGGIAARPAAQQEAAAHQKRFGPISAQVQQAQVASRNRELRASLNRGNPPVAATPRAGAFDAPGVERAKKAGGSYIPPSDRNTIKGHPEGVTPRSSMIHPANVPSATHPRIPNTGNSKLEEKHEQQQEKLAADQARERQKLEQQQVKEQQKLEKQRASDQKKQQVEQKHQEQTQKLMQQQEKQRQNLQHKQQQHPPAPKHTPHTQEGH